MKNCTILLIIRMDDPEAPRNVSGEPDRRAQRVKIGSEALFRYSHAPVFDRGAGKLLVGKGSSKLEGVEKGYRKVVWPYRILYTIDDENKIVDVYLIAHRKEAYR